VLEVVSTTHLVCDLTLGLGKVVHDYLDVSPKRRGISDRHPLASEASGYGHLMALP
jgi:acetoacetate decarboxylase